MRTYSFILLVFVCLVLYRAATGQSYWLYDSQTGVGYLGGFDESGADGNQLIGTQGERGDNGKSRLFKAAKKIRVETDQSAINLSGGDGEDGAAGEDSVPGGHGGDGGHGGVLTLIAPEVEISSLLFISNGGDGGAGGTGAGTSIGANGPIGIATNGGRGGNGGNAGGIVIYANKVTAVNEGVLSFNASGGDGGDGGWGGYHHGNTWEPCEDTIVAFPKDGGSGGKGGAIGFIKIFPLCVIQEVDFAPLGPVEVSGQSRNGKGGNGGGGGSVIIFDDIQRGRGGHGGSGGCAGIFDTSCSTLMFPTTYQTHGNGGPGGLGFYCDATLDLGCDGATPGIQHDCDGAVMLINCPTECRPIPKLNLDSIYPWNRCEPLILVPPYPDVPIPGDCPTHVTSLPCDTSLEVLLAGYTDCVSSLCQSGLSKVDRTYLVTPPLGSAAISAYSTDSDGHQITIKDAESGEVVCCSSKQQGQTAFCNWNTDGGSYYVILEALDPVATILLDYTCASACGQAYVMQCGADEFIIDAPITPEVIPAYQSTAQDFRGHWVELTVPPSKVATVSVEDKDFYWKVGIGVKTACSAPISTQAWSPTGSVSTKLANTTTSSKTYKLLINTHKQANYPLVTINCEFIPGAFCQTAIPVTPGQSITPTLGENFYYTHNDKVTCFSSATPFWDVWYRITVPAGQQLTVTTTDEDLLGPVGIDILEGCIGPVLTSNCGQPTATATYQNTSSSPNEVFVLANYNINSYPAEITFTCTPLGEPGSSFSNPIYAQSGEMYVTSDVMQPDFPGSKVMEGSTNEYVSCAQSHGNPVRTGHWLSIAIPASQYLYAVMGDYSHFAPGIELYDVSGNPIAGECVSTVAGETAGIGPFANMTGAPLEVRILVNHHQHCEYGILELYCTPDP